MNNLDKQYLDLLRDIKENGVRKVGRNGATYSVFGRQIRHDMSEGFPLLTTKKMWFKGIRTELEWFLNGDTNIKYLVERGNNIWVGDAYKRYKEYFKGESERIQKELNKNNFAWSDSLYADRIYNSEQEFIKEIKNNNRFAEKWGDMGHIYGWQWRKWEKYIVHSKQKVHGKVDNFYIINTIIEQIDQIQNLIDDLQNKPDSRRIMVNAWNVGEIDDMVLPPCHYGFQVWTRELTLKERKELFKEKFDRTIEDFDAEWETNGTSYEEDLDFNNIPKRGISLIWNQRSVDTPLGLPFNIASYGLLLKMIADEVNMVPLELIGNLGDTHIYENQLEGVEKQLKRESHPLPTLFVRDGIYSRGEFDIVLENYESEDKIEFPLSN